MSGSVERPPPAPQASRPRPRPSEAQGPMRLPGPDAPVSRAWGGVLALVTRLSGLVPFSACYGPTRPREAARGGRDGRPRAVGGAIQTRSREGRVGSAASAPAARRRWRRWRKEGRPAEGAQPPLRRALVSSCALFRRALPMGPRALFSVRDLPFPCTPSLPARRDGRLGGLEPARKPTPTPTRRQTTGNARGRARRGAANGR